jgi:hypothetical protein
MSPSIARLGRLARFPALLLITLGTFGECLAADPGRLFYTPAQRAQLEAARARNVTQASPAAAAIAHPQRFDGVVIRSDGASTSWINGRPQTGVSGAAGLKPGQVRSDGKVYEPYQVLRPAHEEPTR